MSQPLDIDGLTAWLCDSSVSNDWIDHQDGEWVIASSFDCDQLIPLVSIAHADKARRDSLIFALEIQLECVLDPTEPDDPKSLEKLTNFVIENWEDVLRIDRERGLGHDFDTVVVPYINSHLGRDPGVA